MIVGNPPVGQLTRKNNETLGQWYISLMVKENPYTHNTQGWRIVQSQIASYSQNIARIYREGGDLSLLHFDHHVKLALMALLDAAGDIPKAQKLFEKAKKKGTTPLDPTVGDLA